MNWMQTSQLLGNLGEFIGAIAVVVTLIFLAVQVRLNRIAVRENNALARAAAVDQVFEQFTGHRRLIASDADVARVWLKGRQGDDLEPIDELRFQQLAFDYMIVFGNMAQRGFAIGNRAMMSAASSLLSDSIAGSPGLDRIWRSGVGVQEPFVRAVNAALSKRGTDPR